MSVICCVLHVMVSRCTLTCSSVCCALASLCQLEETMVQRQYRIPYLEKCIALIDTSKSVPQALHLIQKLLDSFPDTPTAIEDRTKSSIIQHLQKETGVSCQDTNVDGRGSCSRCRVRISIHAVTIVHHVLMPPMFLFCPGSHRLLHRFRSFPHTLRRAYRTTPHRRDRDQHHVGARGDTYTVSAADQSEVGVLTL